MSSCTSTAELTPDDCAAALQRVRVGWAARRPGDLAQYMDVFKLRTRVNTARRAAVPSASWGSLASLLDDEGQPVDVLVLIRRTRWVDRDLQATVQGGVSEKEVKQGLLAPWDCLV